jgi:hypothetical protein
MTTEYELTNEVRQKVLALSIKEIRFAMADMSTNAHASEYYDLLNAELNKRRERDESNIKG